MTTKIMHILFYLIYGPFFNLFVFFSSFVCFLSISLALGNLLIFQAVQAYNSALGLPVEFRASWNSIYVKGLYPGNWAPPQSVPDIPQTQLLLKMSENSYLIVFVTFFIISLLSCSVVFFSQTSRTKINLTKEEEAKICFLGIIAFPVTCLLSLFFLSYGGLALKNELNIISCFCQNMSSGLAMAFESGHEGVHLTVSLPPPSDLA